MKAKVRTLLAKLKPYGWLYAPVETGFGTRAVDFLGCYRGHFFAIECKATATANLTPRQKNTVTEIQAAGGTVFVVRGDDGLSELEAWLNQIQ